MPALPVKTRERYQQELRRNLTGINQSGNIEEDWENIKESMTKAAETIIGTKGTKHREWISAGTEDLVERRRLAKVRRDSTRTRSSTEAYRRLDALVKKKCSQRQAGLV